METLEELKAIIDNAQDGATLVDIADDGEIDYMYRVMENESGEKILSCSNNEDAAIEYGDGNIRSLSDIKRIIELMELLEGISAIGFLEATNDSGKSHRDVCKKAKLILGDL